MPEGDTIHNAARRVGAALVGKPIEARGQGDHNRTTYWCPTCQA
jgi:formamidopyrimidine-DNA glycosylase